MAAVPVHELSQSLVLTEDRRRMRRIRATLVAGALGATLLLAATTSQAVSLRKAVRYAMQTYPSIIAAQSDRSVASFDIQRARGKHYPSFDLAGSQRLSGEVGNRFGPRMRMNVWASGAIEAEVERETWREQALGSASLLTRENVAFDVVSAYFALLGAIEQSSVAKRNLDRHLALVADFREIARIDQGRRFDLVQAQARLGQVEFTLAEKDAEIKRAQQGLFRFYPFAVPLDDIREPAVLSEPEQLNQARTLAILEQHPSVIAARQRLLAAQANVKMAKGTRGPRLDVEARAGADSFTQLTMSWPAFDITAGATEDAAVAALTGAQASVDEQLRLASEEQQIARQNWNSARDRQRIAQSQVAVAQELVTVYREQFGIGRRNLLDLLNAYAELANAETSAQGSRIEALLARHQMEHASGRLSLLFLERIR